MKNRNTEKNISRRETENITELLVDAMKEIKEFYDIDDSDYACWLADQCLDIEELTAMSEITGIDMGALIDAKIRLEDESEPEDISM